MQTMYYIELEVHKRTISYCVKDGSGTIHAKSTIAATRFDLDRWVKTLPRPWSAAMEATVFTGSQFGVLAVQRPVRAVIHIEGRQRRSRKTK